MLAAVGVNAAVTTLVVVDLLHSDYYGDIPSVLSIGSSENLAAVAASVLAMLEPVHASIFAGILRILHASALPLFQPPHGTDWHANDASVWRLPGLAVLSWRQRRLLTLCAIRMVFSPYPVCIEMSVQRLVCCRITLRTSH